MNIGNNIAHLQCLCRRVRLFAEFHIPLGSVQRGGRQEIGILGNKSSVRQRSARSSPPRRRRIPLEIGLYKKKFTVKSRLSRYRPIPNVDILSPTSKLSNDQHQQVT